MLCDVLGRGQCRYGGRRAVLATAGVAAAMSLCMSVCTACGFAAPPTGQRQGAVDVPSSAPTSALLEGALPDSATPTSPPPTSSVSSAGLTAADLLAGLRSRQVPQRGGGHLVTVPGSVPAPGSGRVVRVRVEVESGLDVDGQAFARFVLATLNDPRSWGHGGVLTFARTDGAATIRVVLASPDTSAAMCRPLVTFGRLSCGSGNTAVLTLYRWVHAIPGYGNDKTGYRRYVVNHEVGHTLGHGHVTCPGPGSLAPVMMQQTKGLNGCRPNPWPFP